MGIQINGNTDNISATDGGLSVDGFELNQTGVSTFHSHLHVADQIIHLDDANSKIRFPAADTITAETAGSERLRITSSGQIGVGINNPSSPGSYTKFLEVSDNNAASIIVSRSASGTAHKLEMGAFSGASLIESTGATSLRFKTNSTERLRITSSGEVKIMNTSGTVGLYFQSSSGAVSNFRAIGTNNQSLGYFFGNSERVRFSSDGKVGINTDDARFNNASNIASASFYHNDPKFGVYGSMVIGNLSATATDERQLAFYRRGGPAPGTPMSTHKMGRIAWYGSSNDTSLPDLAGSIECVPNGGGWTAGSNRRGSITNIDILK